MKKKRSTNGTFRERWYPFLVKRDGEHCKICGKGPTEAYLEIDHKDGNPKNNDPDNLQLLCRSDNRKKNPRGKGRTKGLLQDSSAVDENRPASPELTKNRYCEPRFRHWLYDEMRKRGEMLLHEVLNGGAEAAGCSPTTIRRYLAKVTSIVGICEIRTEDMGAGIKVTKVCFKSGLSIGVTADLLGDSSTEQKP